MSGSPAPLIPPSKGIPVPTADPSVWDRITTWASEHKAVVYTIAGVTVVVAGAGVFYYVNNSSAPKGDSTPKLSKKERRKRKEAERKAESEKEKAANTSKEAVTGPAQPPVASVESADELPEIDETTVQTLSVEERARTATKLKEAGNKAYGSKDFNKAIELYSQAIICKPDPVFYSNRAACYNALANWEKVVEDTTAAVTLDPEYVKALNRRANAYDHLGKYSESLLDYTASCIIDGFKNPSSAEAVERLLKKFAESKAKEMMATKPAKLPSPTFVGNYLQSFRVKPRPTGLEDSNELPESTGMGQLQVGLRALEVKTGEGYEEAATAFDKALELGDLGEYEAFAYNMRGTFQCLRGKHEDALLDLTKSIELDPAMTQSYIKRASMNLELGAPEKAEEDFEAAMKQNSDDPDIYYHRAQLHFIKGEFSEAAKDYQKSIDLDRDFIFSHIQLGVTQYKMGSIASSMATFRRCMKNFDKVPDVYNYYGELLLDQGKYQEAIEKFETAIQMEKQAKPTSMNVLPLINKSLAIFQSKQDFAEAEKLCQKALIIDPECDIAVATMAQLLLQQGKVTEALKYFERAAELARTEGELVNALSYAEATRTQIQVQEKYPALASKLQGMGGPPGLR
ncbi:putative mitochondrial outer membrane 72k protein [Phaeoacremonium minimum UCRPA7]|uniref:Putative mitochondrial outer membrane 72k protein n=1 Tax=Phaeoacremonium minimum (strain UCR-PA7) TaxID=1286976 RepID=R8BTE7_PHAM7|nr:putative mitochondrial outer membrane 72k protein [Phaeoacremonium minimum UCRPA7]EOO02621.1 putative mitochondrial outer membrane 72k protein [Phaeoacremonium minimum UCRPA7]